MLQFFFCEENLQGMSEIELIVVLNLLQDNLGHLYCKQTKATHSVDLFWIWMRSQIPLHHWKHLNAAPGTLERRWKHTLVNHISKLLKQIESKTLGATLYSDMKNSGFKIIVHNFITQLRGQLSIMYCKKPNQQNVLIFYLAFFFFFLDTL